MSFFSANIAAKKLGLSRRRFLSLVKAAQITPKTPEKKTAVKECFDDKDIKILSKYKNIAEASKITGLSKQTIYSLIKQNKIGSAKYLFKTSKIFISEEEIEKIKLFKIKTGRKKVRCYDCEHIDKKICKKCRRELCPTNFHLSDGKRNKKRIYCKDCDLSFRKEYANKDTLN